MSLHWVKNYCLGPPGGCYLHRLERRRAEWRKATAGRMMAQSTVNSVIEWLEAISAQRQPTIKDGRPNKSPVSGGVLEVAGTVLLHGASWSMSVGEPSMVFGSGMGQQPWAQWA